MISLPLVLACSRSLQAAQNSSFLNTGLPSHSGLRMTLPNGTNAFSGCDGVAEAEVEAAGDGEGLGVVGGVDDDFEELVDDVDVDFVGGFLRSLAVTDTAEVITPAAGITMLSAAVAVAVAAAINVTVGVGVGVGIGREVRKTV